MQKKINPIDYSSIFQDSEYNEPSAWLGHIPIAKWLIEVIRPKVLVELGTHNGMSYVSFCEAALFINLSSNFFAVDTWVGDSHAGLYGEAPFLTLKKYHDEKFGHFSTLLRKTFDEALADFEDHSIDLLHIDGFHSYEAVKHDFETWLPKMAEGGVVLFHDTNEFQDGFGVWEFWDQVKNGKKNFNFLHTHGLGILAIDNNYPPELDVLFKATEEDNSIIQGFFEYAGKVHKYNYQIKVLTEAAAAKEQLQIDQIKVLTEVAAEKEQLRIDQIKDLTEAAAAKEQLQIDQIKDLTEAAAAKEQLQIDQIKVLAEAAAAKEQLLQEITTARGYRMLQALRKVYVSLFRRS